MRAECNKGSGSRWLRNLVVVGALLLAGASFAQPVSGQDVKSAMPAAEDAALEARVKAFSYKLRCLVCQNETIADSRAPLALDLRDQVREQFAAGKSESEVREFMVSRYGDFVLYSPPLKGTTLLLWFGPALLLVAGAAWLGYRLRIRQREEAPPLSDEERARARALLNGARTNTEESRT